MIISVVLILLIFIPLRNGAQTTPFAAAGQRHYSLAYDYPANAIIRYLNYNMITQTIDNRGKKVDAMVATLNYCSVRNTAMDDLNLRLEFTVDSIGQYFETASKSTSSGSNISGGRSFWISFTPAGDREETIGLSDLVFENDDGSALYAGQFFTDFFPLLPGGRIVDGYEWDSADTLITDFGESSQTIILDRHNTVGGEVWYKGRECVKISSSTKGIIDIRSFSNKTAIHVTGEIIGSREYYFCKAEGNFIYLGYLLFDKENSSVTGTLEMDDGRKGSFPIKMSIERIREMIE